MAHLVSGKRPQRFMVVGARDSLSAGSKTGVVAPVPINTPSLRQEIHSSQGDAQGIIPINRSGGAGGWGSVATNAPPSGSGGNNQAGNRGKVKGRGTGDGGFASGDDVFTRHFPDLRAGLEQAEKLDAATKASNKVAPLRKPKAEPVKDQGRSLRPRGVDKLDRTQNLSQGARVTEKWGGTCIWQLLPLEVVKSRLTLQIGDHFSRRAFGTKLDFLSGAQQRNVFLFCICVINHRRPLGAVMVGHGCKMDLKDDS